MPSRIAIIRDEIHPLIKRIQNTLQNQGIICDLRHWSDLSYDLTGPYQSSLNEYDMIYLDRLGEFSRSYSTQIELLSGLSTPENIVNSPFSYWTARNKMLIARSLYRSGLPTPKTFICFDQSRLYQHIVKSQDKSFVVKAFLGCCSEDVIVFDSKNIANVSFGHLFEKDSGVVCQEFIYNPDRYIWRIDIVGRDIIVSNKRYSFNQDSRHPLCNGTQGGDIEFFAPNEVPNNIQKLCLTAMDEFELEIAGIDIAVDKDRTPYVIEVNPEPDFTTGRFEFPDAIARYLLKRTNNILSGGGVLASS